MSDREQPPRLAILVHELRSPVAALRAIHEALRTRPADREEPSQHVRLALAAAGAVERIVTDASLTSLDRRPTDVARLLEDAAEAARLGGGRVRVGAAAVPSLQADPVRVRQAVDNLLSNALAHTRDDSDVVLGARVEDDHVIVSVTDAGPGIAEADQRRVFEPGVRLDASYAGSGLGLAVVKAIAEAHGGRAFVRSAPGAGATFSIALPLSGAQPATEARRS